MNQNFKYYLDQLCDNLCWDLHLLFCSTSYSDRGMLSNSVLRARARRWCCYTWSSIRPLPASSRCAAAVVVVVTSPGDAASQGQLLLLLFQSKLSESSLTAWRRFGSRLTTGACKLWHSDIDRSVGCSGTEIAPYPRVLLTAAAGDQPVPRMLLKRFFCLTLVLEVS